MIEHMGRLIYKNKDFVTFFTKIGQYFVKLLDIQIMI